MVPRISLLVGVRKEVATGFPGGPQPLCITGTYCAHVWHNDSCLVSCEVVMCGPLGHISQAEGLKVHRLNQTCGQCVRSRSGGSQGWEDASPMACLVTRETCLVPFLGRH